MEQTKKLVLALGEGSNTHILTSKKEIDFKVDEATEQVEFILHSQGILTHEEHAKIVLEQGKYKKYPQMEYDPFTENLRAVFD